MAVPAASRVQELDPVDIDEIPVVFGTRLFVVPRLSTLPAFEINAGTFVQILADDPCPPTEGLHGKALRVFLQFAALVLPSFRGGDGELRDGRSPVGCISPQDHGRDFRSTLLSASCCVILSCMICGQ